MIAVIIPTLDEEKAIKEVINGFPDIYRGFEVEKYVIDGGSCDRTVSIAKGAGAEVLHQKLDGGKGNGVRQCMNEVDADIYVMIDGDGTYSPDEFSKIVDPVIDGEAEQVIGRRSRREEGSIPKLNLVGNKIFNLVTRLTTREKIHDMLSGYRSFSKESLKYTDMTRPGFGIETEMTFTAIENNVPIKEVDIKYAEREGDSKLNPVSDGWRIFTTLIWSIRDMNPLKFFSSVSFFLMLLAVYPSYLTIEQRLRTGEITNIMPALTASVFLILAVQLMIVGLISDQIKNVEKRLRNQI